MHTGQQSHGVLCIGGSRVPASCLDTQYLILRSTRRCSYMSTMPLSGTGRNSALYLARPAKNVWLSRFHKDFRLLPQRILASDPLPIRATRNAYNPALPKLVTTMTRLPSTTSNSRHIPSAFVSQKSMHLSYLPCLSLPFLGIHIMLTKK
ncbi:hypothetical protein BKA80DRAFT_26839 [Phyllosticta citrichinensis]